jgi:hypothetical protein
MADIFLRNIDLMHHVVNRRAPNAPSMEQLKTRISSLIWDDIPLVQFTPTRLRQSSIPRCTSITIQISYLYTAVPGAAPWPIVTIRDGSVATNAPLVTFNGFELIPGAMISFEADEKELEEEHFLDPTEFYAFLNNILAVRLHICYGVFK